MAVYAAAGRETFPSGKRNLISAGRKMFPSAQTMMQENHIVIQ